MTEKDEYCWGKKVTFHKDPIFDMSDEEQKSFEKTLMDSLVDRLSVDVESFLIENAITGDEQIESNTDFDEAEGPRLSFTNVYGKSAYITCYLCEYDGLNIFGREKILAHIERHCKGHKPTYDHYMRNYGWFEKNMFSWVERKQDLIAKYLNHPKIGRELNQLARNGFSVDEQFDFIKKKLIAKKK